MNTEDTLALAIKKLYALSTMVEPYSMSYIGLMESIRLLENKLVELQTSNTV